MFSHFRIKYNYLNHDVQKQSMKYLSLLLLSVLFIPIVQVAHAQNIIDQIGSAFSNLTSGMMGGNQTNQTSSTGSSGGSSNQTSSTGSSGGSGLTKLQALVPAAVHLTKLQALVPAAVHLTKLQALVPAAVHLTRHLPILAPFKNYRI